MPCLASKRRWLFGDAALTKPQSASYNKCIYCRGPRPPHPGNCGERGANMRGNALTLIPNASHRDGNPMHPPPSPHRFGQGGHKRHQKAGLCFSTGLLPSLPPQTSIFVGQRGRKRPPKVGVYVCARERCWFCVIAWSIISSLSSSPQTSETVSSKAPP